MVPFLLPLLLALTMNMAIYLSVDQSRFFAELQRYLRLKAEGRAPGCAPILLSLSEAAYNGSMYAFKYALKSLTSERNAKVLSKAVNDAQVRGECHGFCLISPGPEPLRA